MKKSVLAVFLALALLLIGTQTALAADVFKFETRKAEIFEGETFETVLSREGNPAEDGELTYKVTNEKVATVDENGVITAVSKGTTTVKAVLKGEKRSWTAEMTVSVLRAVTKVTLNTTKMNVYQPTDEKVSGLLREETQYDVILIAAGKSMSLNTTCTPETANNRKVTYTSTDEGVVKISGNNMRALQAGECDLTVASVQNPEVTETYHVLVVQPVTKINITSDSKTVNAGEKITLTATCEPDNASITQVTWTSKNEKVATVDENGVVTGVSKGGAAIVATATDGSGRLATFNVTVTQKPTSVTLKETGTFEVVAGRTKQLHYSVLPATANDRTVSWESSDESIATVNSYGVVTGVKRGSCEILVTCNGDVTVQTSIQVDVVQLVTSIKGNPAEVSLEVNTTAQLGWTVEPADASNPAVTFTTSNKNVATVDESGVVTGHKRGTANIYVKATDGSGRTGTIKVTVIQPVQGMNIQYDVYHIQLNGNLNVRAQIQPSDANNKNVHFTIADESIATVKDKGSMGNVRGKKTGNTIVTAVTEDGGFTDTAEIRVADFNRAVVVDDLYLEGQNVRMVFRNRSNFTVDRIYFTVTMYDGNGDPLVCNTDGESNYFTGMYKYEVGPEGVTQHYVFTFENYVQPTTTIGAVTVAITGWRDLEGYTRNIKEDFRPSLSYQRFVQK